MKYKNVKVMEVDDDLFTSIEDQPNLLIERLEGRVCNICDRLLTDNIAIIYIEFPEKGLTMWWHTFTSGHEYSVPGCHEYDENNPKSYSQSYQEHTVETLDK